MLKLITELGARYDILAYKCACIFLHHGNTFTKLHRKMRFNSYNHEVSKVGMQCGKRNTENVRTIKLVPSELDIHSKKSITQKSRYAMVCGPLVLAISEKMEIPYAFYLVQNQSEALSSRPNLIGHYLAEPFILNLDKTDRPRPKKRHLAFWVMDFCNRQLRNHTKSAICN